MVGGRFDLCFVVFIFNGFNGAYVTEIALAFRATVVRHILFEPFVSTFGARLERLQLVAVHHCDLEISIREKHVAAVHVHHDGYCIVFEVIGQALLT
jgi:hypothetical protein